MSEHAGAVDPADWFADADSIVVSDNLGQQLAVVDPERIADVLAALGAIADGWASPQTEMPVARVRLNFRSGDRPLGNIGLGVKFLIAHVHGTFLARPADTGTSVDLLAAAGAHHVARRLSRRS